MIASKRILKKVFLGALLIGLAWAMAWSWLDNFYVVPIMMYHHVGENRQIRSDTVSPRLFEYQMNFLKRHGYHVLRLDELIQGIKFQKDLPERSVAITFDDGYEDNYTQAFPILKKYGFPATFFISPDFIGQEGYLNIEQIKQMMTQGVAFGDHSMSHAYLPDCTPEVLAIEVESSKKILEKELGTQVDYFAYPVGGFNNGVKKLMPQAGFKAAFTTNRGQDRWNRDAYQLNRIRFGDKDTYDMDLRVKLSGYYNLFRGLKRPY